jgi:hemoglobin-like flavoprotein
MKFLVLALCVVAAAADPHYAVLSSDEGHLIQSSWDQVKTHESDILYAIFKAYPDIQGKFPQFNGKALESIKGTSDFAVHATRIVSFISQLVTLFGHDNVEPALKTLLNDMGHTHAGRSVSKTQFDHFRTAFFTYLEAHTTWGDNVEHAWNKAFDTMYFIIFSNLDGHPVA